MTSTATVERPPEKAPARSLAEWLQHAEALHTKTIDLGLERVERVRDALDIRPRVPVITVAGTNGKGSTCATLAACLQAAGYSVGLYTSPHLLRFNERIRIDGRAVGDAALCRAFAQVEQARDGVALTPFEFGTLAAMRVFVDSDVDAIVLEVGLGGRLDAVNAFDADCAVLTSVALDHQEYLGPTRECIAREKAGIFRAARPAVCAEPCPPSTLLDSVATIGARLLQIGRDFHIDRDGCSWHLVCGDESIGPLPAPRLTGSFQYRNAAAAVLALHALRDLLPVSLDALARGLQDVRLRGRFQRLRHRGVDTVLDVAHNPEAAAALAENLAAEPCPGRTLVVFAMLRDKDVAGVACCLAQSADIWFIAGLQERRGASADEIATALAAADVPGRIVPGGTPMAAYERACATARPGDRVVVCGSFVTVGQVLEGIGLEA